MKRICVFCGSSPGGCPEYIQAARDLGTVLVNHGIDLVYGGGNVGMMGAVAESVFNAGGHVTGVIPKHLAEKEVAFIELSDLRIVDTMHQRKAMMAELSDGFIAMPGGLGTIEEIFEVWTWGQLNMHQKPCGLLNTCGYYNHLLTFLDHITTEQFVQEGHRQMLIVDSDTDRLIHQFQNYKPVTTDKTRWALKLNAASSV